MTPVDRLRPVATSRTRLGLAALIWTGVGAALLVAGVAWIARAPVGWAAAALAAALVLGLLKGTFLLARGAEANARRILEAGDGRWIGGVFSAGSWALVLVMMILGNLLRGSSLPRPWLGLIYAAAGIALIRASLVSWGYWRRERV